MNQMIDKEINFDIRKKYESLHWDLEYWNSYIYQYKNKEIECSEETRINDLKTCTENKEKILKEIKNLRENYAEYLI